MADVIAAATAAATAEVSEWCDGLVAEAQANAAGLGDQELVGEKGGEEEEAPDESE